MIVSLLAALIGTVLTGAEALLLHLQDSGLCLDEGCRVVDSMTTVEPLYFNLVGLAFFLIVSFGVVRARRGSEGWQRLVSLLLLAGLAAEAVLLSFQTYVAHIYCSYCLAIFGLIVTANVFFGLKQIFRGILIFGSVMLAFASLDFSGGIKEDPPLETGTLARFEPAGADRHYVLFFSSECTHCETVLGSMGSDNTCAISFNPIDTITRFTFPGAVFTDSYRPQVNRKFLKNLKITSIPVLLNRDEETITIIRGETAIREHLAAYCSGSYDPSLPLPGNEALQGQSTITTDWQMPPADDGCSINEECGSTPEPGLVTTPDATSKQ